MSRFRIILQQYGESEPEYEGYPVWTQEQADDLLDIIRVLRGYHTDDCIREGESDARVR